MFTNTAYFSMIFSSLWVTSVCAEKKKDEEVKGGYTKTELQVLNETSFYAKDEISKLSTINVKITLLKEKIYYLQCEIAKSKDAKEIVTLANLLGQKKQEYIEELQKWDKELLLPEDTKPFKINIESDVINLLNLIEIALPDKIVVYKCKVPLDISVSIKCITDIPTANAIEALNTILKNTGISVKKESNNIVSVNKTSYSGSCPDIIINVEDELPESPGIDNILMIISCTKKNANVVKSTIEQHLNIQASSCESTIIVSCSLQEALQIKKVYEVTNTYDSDIVFKKIVCNYIAPSKCANLVGALKYQQSLDKVDKVFCMPLDELGIIVIGGGVNQIHSIEKAINELNADVLASQQKNALKYYPKRLHPNSIIQLLNLKFNIPKTSIIQDPETNELLIFANQETLLTVQEFLKKNDTCPKNVHIECIILETSKRSESGVFFNEKDVTGSHTAPSEQPEGSSGLFHYSQRGLQSIYKMLGLSTNENVVLSFASSLIQESINRFSKICIMSTIRNTKIRSIQNLTVSDQQQGTLKYGTEISVATSRPRTSKLSKDAAYSAYSRQEYGIVLDITVKILSQSEISITMSSKFDSIASNNNATPEVKRRSLNVKDLVAKHKETLLIGQIDHTEFTVEKTMAATPNILNSVLSFLCKLIGFGNDVSEESKETMLSIAIIPTILEK